MHNLVVVDLDLLIVDYVVIYPEFRGGSGQSFSELLNGTLLPAKRGQA